MADRFQIDTNDFLALNYESYKNDLYAVCLSTPSEYMKLRKETLNVVKNQNTLNFISCFQKVRI